MLDLQDKSLDELQSLVAEAQAALQAKQNAMRKEVMAEMKHLAASIGVTINIIENDKNAKPTKPAVAPKYRNPDNDGETWTGRGLRPRWLQERMDNGAKLEDFLIG